jgi:hypothetical protein
LSSGFDGDDDGGGPEAAGGFADEAGVTDGGGIDRHLISSGREHSANIFERSESASDSEGDKDFAGGAGDDFAEAVAAVETGDSILIDQFVGSGFVVVASEGFGVPEDTKSFEANAFDETGSFDIQSSDDTNHGHK